MGPRILIIRKYIFYYRKSKFRRTKKNGKECPTHDLGSLNSVMTASDRKNTDTRFNSRIQLLHLKTFLLDKGWIGVNNLPFIICGLIICFVPSSYCSPLWRRVGQEIPKFGMITTRSDNVADYYSIHNPSVNDNDRVTPTSKFNFSDFHESGENNNSNKIRIFNNKWNDVVINNNSSSNSGEEVLGLRKNKTYDGLDGGTVRRSKRKTLMIGDDVVSF